MSTIERIIVEGLGARSQRAVLRFYALHFAVALPVSAVAVWVRYTFFDWDILPITAVACGVSLACFDFWLVLRHRRRGTQ